MRTSTRQCAAILRATFVWVSLLLILLAAPLGVAAVPSALEDPVDPCADLLVGEFCARYFANTSLADPPTYSARELEIRHNWGSGGPGNGIGVDGFSARWEGTFAFAAGDVTFLARADDGVRLWVDDGLVVDQWKTQSATLYQATVSLTEGSHTVRLEYFEQAGSAVAELYWRLPCPAGQFRAEYFGNKALSGIPQATACEPAVIHYDWGTGGPIGRTDGFSVRWTGLFPFDEGVNTFVATVDDGARLWVDGSLVVDQWRDQAATTYQVSRSLAAGSHAVKLEYYESAGDAVAKLRWMSACPEGQAAASYFANATLEGMPAITRCEPVPPSLAWGTGSPGSGIPADNFSARLEWTAAFAGGSYSFAATADDGVRFWLDGELVIDQWKDQAPTTYRVSRVLSSGNHSLKVEYYERAGGAVLKLNWALQATGVEVIVDDTSSGFTKGGRYWRQDTRGYGGHQWWTYVYGWTVDCWGEWRANLQAGSYEVFAWIPRYNTTTKSARYTIYHQGGQTVKVVDQNLYVDQWASLGTYSFAAGVTRQVRLTDATGEPTNSRVIAFDAMRFVPRGAAPPPAARNQGLQGGSPMNDAGSIDFPHSVKSNLPLIVDAGAGWIRINFRQADCIREWETSICNGKLALEAYDALVRDARSRGLKILGLLSNESWEGHQVTDWIVNAPEDPNGTKDPAFAPGDNAYIQGFARGAAVPLIRHYQQPDIRIDAWQIWNEPNCATGLVGGQPRGCSYIYPSNFAWLLRHVYEDTRAAGITGVRIVTGGILGTDPVGATRVLNGVPVTVRGDYRSTAVDRDDTTAAVTISAAASGAQYLADTYRFGISSAGWESIRATYGTYPLDDVGQHLYVDQYSTTSAEKLRGYLDAVRGVYASFEGSSTPKQTVITEFGWSTAAVSQATQAANLRIAYTAFRATPYLRHAFWFFAQDQPAASLYFGLRTAGSASDGYKGTAKESFRAYQETAGY